MVTNQMLLMRDAARSLKALPDIKEAAYMKCFERAQEECMTAIERKQYEPLGRNLALFGPRLLVESGEIAALREDLERLPKGSSRGERGKRKLPTILVDERTA
jgi:hypothetical protein